MRYRTDFIFFALLLLVIVVTPIMSEAQIPCVSGFVTDPYGNPIVDGDLDFDDAITGERIYTPGDNTDVSGFYRVCLLPGLYNISYAPPMETNLMGKRIYNVSLTAGQFLELNVTLDQGVVIKGKITNELGGVIGNTDVDADIIVTGERIYTPNDNSDTLTGDYWIVVKPETYRLRYQPPQKTRYKAVQLDSIPIFADTIINITMVEGVLLSGFVSNSSGLKLQDISIDLRDQISGDKIYLAYNESDSTGYYRVPVDTGLYSVRYVPPLGSRYIGTITDSVHIQTDTTINMSLSEGIIATFNITDSIGNTIERADIDLFNTLTGSKAFTPHDKTDRNGTTSVSFAPGNYTIRVDPPPETFFDRLIIDSTDILNDTIFNLVLPASPKVIVTGSVRNLNGIGIENIAVEFTDTLSGYKIFVPDNLTDIDGKYSVAIPQGIYDVEFIPLPATRYVASITQDVKITTDTLWNPVYLDTGYYFDATVFDPFGDPVENTDFDIISESSMNGIATPFDNTDRNGFARMTVPADIYTIIITPPPGSQWGTLTLTGVSIAGDTASIFYLRDKSISEETNAVLYQNYPNPTNSTTIISYVLYTGCEIEINIYNILGQQLLTIDRDYQPPGFYVFEWDGYNQQKVQAGSGVYLYRLKTPFGNTTKKMVLLK